MTKSQPKLDIEPIAKKSQMWPRALDIIEFWYSPTIAKHWFASTAEVDAEIRRRFEATWEQAASGKLDHWQINPEGCLALAIILDQFPLNMYRGQAKSFSTEAKAIDVARHAIESGFDKQLDKIQLAFLYMPFMHSELQADQARSVQLFTDAGLKENASFALHHRQIVDRFGRFPHRNAILGRKSTDEELTWLASDAAYNG